MKSHNLPALRMTSNQPDPLDAVEVQSVHDDSLESSPYYIIHQYLRDRYLLVIALGVVAASVFGYYGWCSTRPLYRSEALIRVAYEIPKVSQVQDPRPMEVFEAFMQSQQALITSNRVLSLALQQPQWTESGISVNPNAIDGFASDLRVDRHAGTEHLKIIYESANPKMAATAVQTVVAAYVSLYNSLDRQASGEKAKALEQRRAEVVKEMQALDDQVRKASTEYGSSNVERFYDTAVQRLTRVEAMLIDVRIALALAGSSNGSKSTQPRLHYTPQQIARIDPTMARYLAEREDKEMHLQQLRMRGLGEEHKEVLQAKQALDMLADRISDYATEFETTAPIAAAAPATPGTPGLAAQSVESLKAEETNLLALNKEVKETLTAIGARKLQLEQFRAEMDKDKAELTEINQRLETMQIDSGLSGRLSVMSNGEVPLLPFRDRRMHMAAAGAMAGMVLPAIGFVAWGMVRRRYRTSLDAADDLSKTLPLLGILPQLPARLTDPESAADAAQCVHQIRVMLQVQHPEPGALAYLMTSSCPGEGKTSLTAALALSFAAAGARTLVVDADLIGQRLTRGYRMEDKPGFREAIQQAAKLSSCYPTGVERLSIMPAGISDGRDACIVSSKVVRRLIGALKGDFDVILIDSGPILGSLEALVVAQHVDGVILTISREQQKPLVDRAVRQLYKVGAQIAGMVFNKAEGADFRRSVGASSLRSIPRNPESSAMIKAGVTSTSGFGSLVDSVQTYMPKAGAA